MLTQRYVRLCKHSRVSFNEYHTMRFHRLRLISAELLVQLQSVVHKLCVKTDWPIGETKRARPRDSIPLAI